MLNEFYCVAFQKNNHRMLRALQAGFNGWIEECLHQGWRYGKTSRLTFGDRMPLMRANILASESRGGCLLEKLLTYVQDPIKSDGMLSCLYGG